MSATVTRLLPAEPFAAWPQPAEGSRQQLVGILSPGDRMPRVREPVREYGAAGMRLVGLVNPEARTVTAPGLSPRAVAAAVETLRTGRARSGCRGNTSCRSTVRSASPAP